MKQYLSTRQRKLFSMNITLRTFVIISPTQGLPLHCFDSVEFPSQSSGSVEKDGL